MSKKKIIYKTLSRCSEDGIYHGCWSVYEDGTRKFISKGRGCYFATNDPFWKEPKDADFKIKIRAQKKRTPIAKQKDGVEYLTTEVDEDENPVDALKLTDEKWKETTSL